MSQERRRLALAGICAALLIAALPGASACTPKPEPGGADSAAPNPAETGEQQPVRKITAWEVQINDEDSYTEGSVTYTIAMNLTATNPSQDAAGAYTGSATAKTDSVGSINGAPLNASAMVDSTQLEFTLTGEGVAGDDALAPLTTEDQVYTGAGSIVMAAAGSGTVGAAGGSFSNTSGQNLKLDVQGGAVTMKVVISGHEYTFQGTLTPTFEQ